MMSLFSLVHATTIMGKTADWSATLSTRRISYRRSLLKALAVCSVVYQSTFMESWLEGKNVAGEARATGMTVVWRRLSNKGVGWGWSQCIKSHHAQKSSGNGLQLLNSWCDGWIRHNIRDVLPSESRKRTGPLLSGLKSFFQIRVNVAFSLEIKTPQSGRRVERYRIAWSPVWGFHSQSSELEVQCRQLVLVRRVLSYPKSLQLSTRRF